MNKLVIRIWAFLLILPLTVVAQSGATWRVGQTTLSFKDSVRNRPLTTELWYPTSSSLAPTDTDQVPFVLSPTIRNAQVTKGRLPLILLSHGTGGSRLTLHWLAASLAQAGFLVAAVDHWGNTYDNPIPEYFAKFWERPQDLSYILTALLRDATWSPSIDPARIGATGFSIGGYSVIALAGAKNDFRALVKFMKSAEGKREADIPEMPNLIQLLEDPAIVASAEQMPNLQDKRIKAVFAMSPAIGQGLVDKQQTTTIHCPVYIVGAESDHITPVKTNAQHYHQLIPGSQYFLFKGKVGHYVFLNEAKESLKKEGVIHFNDDPSVKRGAIHAQVSRLAIDYFNRCLK
jgi:predicted dienelactone hydrolase